MRWDRLGLRRQIHLNQGELPYPEVSGPALETGVDCTKYTANTYNANEDTTFNVDDYACDPRVSLSYPGRVNGNGAVSNLVTGQDLIHAFGDCQITNHQIVPGTCGTGHHYDNDHNGYANDNARNQLLTEKRRSCDRGPA